MARMKSVVDETFYGYPGRRYAGHNRVLPNARGAGSWPGYQPSARPQPLKRGLSALFGLRGGPKPIPSGTYLGAPGAQLSGLGGDPNAGTAWQAQQGVRVLNGLEGLDGKGARVCTILAELTGLTLNQIKDMRTAELEATLEANKNKSAELRTQVDAYGGAAIAASIIKGICAAAAASDSGTGDGPTSAPQPGQIERPDWYNPPQPTLTFYQKYRDIVHIVLAAGGFIGGSYLAKQQGWFK